MAGLVNWLLGRGNRRTDPLPEAFPPAWAEVLRRDVPFVGRLPTEADREQLGRDIYWFVNDKLWTPFDVVIDDRMKVIIAAHACLLLNRRVDLGVFARTREVIVRAGAFGERSEAVAPDGRLFHSVDARIGEAWYRGPIVLAWNAVEPLTRVSRPSHDVVIHEFAHALDHLDGWIDGTPPLENRQAIVEWAEVFGREYQRLRNPLSGGGPSGLDPYGASNPAEFFAVVTEQFFCRPRSLWRELRGLYEQMRRFFGQDTEGWNSEEGGE